MKTTIDSQAVNGESVNEVRERLTTNTNLLDKKRHTSVSTYKTAVKRVKGMPKSQNKDLHYTKHCATRLTDESLAKAITRFEESHRRTASIEDVVQLFKELQTQEPHAEKLINRTRYVTTGNYYDVLHVEDYLYDDVMVDTYIGPRYKLLS